MAPNQKQVTFLSESLLSSELETFRNTKLTFSAVPSKKQVIVVVEPSVDTASYWDWSPASETEDAVASVEEFADEVNVPVNYWDEEQYENDDCYWTMSYPEEHEESQAETLLVSHHQVLEQQEQQVHYGDDVNVPVNYWDEEQYKNDDCYWTMSYPQESQAETLPVSHHQALEQQKQQVHYGDEVNVPVNYWDEEQYENDDCYWTMSHPQEHKESQDETLPMSSYAPLKEQEVLSMQPTKEEMEVEQYCNQAMYIETRHPTTEEMEVVLQYWNEIMYLKTSSDQYWLDGYHYDYSEADTYWNSCYQRTDQDTYWTTTAISAY